MFIPVYFTYDLKNYDKVTKAVTPDDICIAFIITQNNLDSFPLFMKDISHTAGARFCFLFDFTKAWNIGEEQWDRMLDNIVSVSFFRRYSRLLPFCPLILLRGNPVTVEQKFSEIRNRFVSQGYEDVDYRFLNPSTPDGYQTMPEQFIYTIDNSEDICKRYSTILGEALYTDDALMVEMEDNYNLQEVLKKLSAVEADLEVNDKQVFNLYVNNKNLQEKNLKLLFRQNSMKEKIEAVESYFSSNLQSKQVKDIYEFYKKEYEILPLWYKRMGHLIKVLMGRRTFRSLFSDNVKKYKE